MIWTMPTRCHPIPLFSLCLALSSALLRAHDATPMTHSFDRGEPQTGPRLQISITDAATGREIAARFTLDVDGREYAPAWIDQRGIRFRSIHRTKRQEFIACYTRGSGAVTVGLPAGARNVEVIATRGFEYRPARDGSGRAGSRVDYGELESLDRSRSPGLDRRRRASALRSTRSGGRCHVAGDVGGRRVDRGAFHGREGRHDAWGLGAAVRLWSRRPGEGCAALAGAGRGISEFAYHYRANAKWNPARNKFASGGSPKWLTRDRYRDGWAV